KRGSGVRRLVLISFFKAEAERLQSEFPDKGVIYAIEEPETSQHPSNQRLLIEAFQELASSDKCQVLITTHVPALVEKIPTESL
ncbi:AAA family ATPase, partial [Escherichia coli]